MAGDLLKRSALVVVVGPRRPSPCTQDEWAAIERAVCLFVEAPQRFHDIVETDRGLRTHPQLRRGLDGAGVGRPGRQDGAFLIEGQVGIGHHLRRVIERLGGMQQFVELEVHTISLCHNLLLGKGRRAVCRPATWFTFQAALRVPFALSCATLPIAILRGFILSGTRRRRLMCSNPFSNAALSTSTYSARLNRRSNARA